MTEQSRSRAEAPPIYGLLTGGRLTTHQEKSVGLSDPIPVTGDLMCQMNWFLAANEGKDLSFEDLIAHVNLLSVGASFFGEGVFIIDVSDATCREKKICLTESERDAYFKDREEYVASHFDLVSS